METVGKYSPAHYNTSHTLAKTPPFRNQIEFCSYITQGSDTHTHTWLSGLPTQFCLSASETFRRNESKCSKNYYYYYYYAFFVSFCCNVRLNDLHSQHESTDVWSILWLQALFRGTSFELLQPDGR
jgi:hypothetical protein